MSPRTRRILTALALAILLFSLAALLFVVWPLETQRVQATVAPALLTPP